MPKVRNQPQLESIVNELEQLGGVAEILADRITGEDLDSERAAFLLANRLKALSAELEEIGLQIGGALPPATEVAHG